MKRRYKTWEIIVAGCLFTVLGIYVINPSSSAVEQKAVEIHSKIQLPETPVAPKLNIDLKELEQLKNLEGLEQLREELNNIRKEIRIETSGAPEVPLPPLKNLPKVLINSN